MRGDFSYIRPETLDEALEVLDRWGEKARVIAGGTDLLIEMKKGKVGGGVLVDIDRLRELHFLELSDGFIRMGPLLTHREIASSELLRREARVLSLASGAVGSPQIRNVATIGGNICNASPAADTLPALMVLEAELTLRRKGGERRVPFGEFFTAPYRTVLDPGELLVEISFRPLGEGWRSAFFKLSRRKAFSMARISAAVALKMEGERVREARISVGSSTPTPARMKEAEEFLKGKALDEERIAEVASMVSQEMVGKAGRRPSTAYKSLAVQGLLKRTLREAVHG